MIRNIVDIAGFVTSLAEVWIEIDIVYLRKIFKAVTSLAEVWIEINERIYQNITDMVTSLAEVWIEIDGGIEVHTVDVPSLPLRKCGLKYAGHTRLIQSDQVTSLAEVWIEITPAGNEISILRDSHFPCGSVD